MIKFKFIKKENIDKLPKTAGVYAFRDKAVILYIGKAKNLRERVKNHFSQPTYKDENFTNLAQKIGYIKTDSEIEALILEANLIKKYRPKYNIVWKDDKNYFFVGFTKEDFPKVFITHQFKIQILEAGVDYVGPFVDGNSLKQTLKFLRKAFPYRTCNLLPKKPCLWYQLGRCPAPCILKYPLAKQIPISEPKMKKEYKENIGHLVEILQGKEKTTITRLGKEMKRVSKDQNFEKAGKIRDKIRVLERTFAHAKVLEMENNENNATGNWQNNQKGLQRIIGYKGNISKIEAYDISNIQGKNATGSQVAFVNGKPDKKLYRKFKIQSPNEPNDVGMLKEILQRRFNHSEWSYPEVILIDGGKPQINAAISVKNQYKSTRKIFILAIAKKHNELFIEGRKEPILLKNTPRLVSDLILCLRDEAHRFAINYHIKLRRGTLLEKR